jgi:hypothetical protein
MQGFWTAAGAPPPVPPAIDPRLVYDPASGRFFAASVWNDDPPPSGQLLVAVSKSSNPLDGWNGFGIDTDPTGQGWPDQSMLAIDGQGVYLTAGLSVGGNAVVVLPKADLVGTTPSVANKTLFAPVSTVVTGFQPAPVTKLDGGGLPTPLLAAGVSYFGVLQTATISGLVAAPSLSKGPLILLSQNPKAPDAQQPGSAPVIFQDTAAGFRSGVVQRNGAIWAVHTVASPSGRDAVEWLRFDAGTQIVLQSGLIEDPSLDFIIPSIAVNEFDEVMIGFSGTGTDKYLSAYAVFGKKVAGEMIFGAPLLLKSGIGSIDHVDALGRTLVSEGGATVVDPDEPHRFWTFQDFGAGDGLYGVQVSEVSVVPEPPSTGAAAGLMLGLSWVGYMRDRGGLGGTQRGPGGEGSPHSPIRSVPTRPTA